MSGQPKPKLRVFISHCCTSVVEDEAVLQAFIEALSPYATVLVDRHFSRYAEPGWRKNVRDWISSCHIAISLFGKRAGRDCINAGHSPSDHIHDESHDLARRLDNQQAFNWLLVKLDTLEIADLQKNAGHRYANITQDALLPPNDALERAINLVKTLSDLCNADIPLRSFLLQTMKIVKDELQADPSVIADYFGYDPGYFSPADLIEQVKHRLTNEATESLEAAIRIAEALSLTPQTQKQLASCLCPLWINPDVALQLRQHFDQKGACSLGSGQTYEVASRYTARWTLSRAFQKPLYEDVHGKSLGLLTPDKSIIVDTALSDQSDADELQNQIEAYLCSRLGVSDTGQLTEELIDRKSKRKAPIVILMPIIRCKYDITIETIGRLKSQYPQLHFFVIHETNATENANIRHSDTASLFDARVDPIRESEAIKSYREAVGETQIPIRRYR